MAYPDMTRIKDLVNKIELASTLQHEYGADSEKTLAAAEDALSDTLAKIEALPVDAELSTKEPDDLASIKSLRPAGPRVMAEDIAEAEYREHIADCADVPSCCLDSNACALKDIFTRANEALYKVFAEVSLAQLADEQREKELSQVLMYHI